MSKGDLVLVYQADLRAAVGVAEVIGVKQTNRGEEVLLDTGDPFPVVIIESASKFADTDSVPYA